ncbi:MULTISPECIES: alkaline shock response membrane anchor protein AmaP [unclassified Enterococcus]|jgi:hypothetical protein|uniref:alkaline shock response membrane anchor protein AmaP n=1 Tax=unclassified Enterococcus TaxID=2608891 RepID=UPI00035294AF|nr:hypothetical protein D920_01093 [Enterococcus faecalis 13-SD-W-01]
MNRGVKVISVIGSLLLLSVLIILALINVPYLMPIPLERFRFFTLTNYYVQQYAFWVAIGFICLIILFWLFLLFSPKAKETFVLKRQDGTLTLDKKAIEGLVRSQLHQEEFIDSPKVNVHATKRKIDVKIKGQLKRTSSLIGQTGTLMKTIEEHIQSVLGTRDNVKVAVRYSGYQENEDPKDNTHSRVD